MTETPSGSSESETTNLGTKKRRIPRNRCPLCGFRFNKPVGPRNAEHVITGSNIQQ